MRTGILRAFAGILTLANLAAFLVVSYFIWEHAGNLDWLLKLPWNSFLTELSDIFKLTDLSAASVWLAWMCLSIALCLVWFFLRISLANALPSSQGESPNPVEARQVAIESQPEFQEKLKLLNRWLS